MSKSLGISYHLHTMAFGAYFFCTPLSMSRFRLCGNFLMRTNDSTILRVCACVVFDVIHQLQFDCQLNLRGFFGIAEKMWKRCTSPISLKCMSCTQNQTFRLAKSSNGSQWDAIALKFYASHKITNRQRYIIHHLFSSQQLTDVIICKFCLL